MNRTSGTYRRLAAVVLAVLVMASPLRAREASQPSSRPATASAPAKEGVLTAPDPDSVKAYDCPSDDGTAIIVEWGKPKDQPPGAWYIVEIAKSQEDLKAGKGKVWKVAPLKASLASSMPKYFGSSKKNESRHFVVIQPALAMEGAGAGLIPFERIERLAKAGVFPRELVGRALAAARIEKPTKKLTDEEKVRRAWWERLKAKLGLAENLRALVAGGYIAEADVKAVAAALANDKPEEKLSAAEGADRRWVARLDIAAPAAKAAQELKAAGILTDQHIAKMAAAMRNRQEGTSLTEAESADRAWLLWLSVKLPVASQVGGLQGQGVLRDADVEDIRALLRKPPDKSESKKFKADKEWLDRLGQWADLLTQLDELNKKDILTDKELEQIRQVARGRKLKDDLTVQEKGGWEWLDRLAVAQDFLLNLDKYLPEEPATRPATRAATTEPATKAVPEEPSEEEKEKDALLKGLITKDQIERIVAVVRDSEPDETIRGKGKSERRWFQLLCDHVGSKVQERKKDRQREKAARTWYFRVAVTDGTKTIYASRDGESVVVSASARPDLFKSFKLNNLIFAVIFSLVVVAFIEIAKRNPNLFIRKIAGLDAVDEAIGRATEMGRPVYFVHGLGAVGDLSTIAALTILGRIARRAAQYDTRARVMNYDPIVTAISQEVVQQAYTEAGRPDAYNPDEVSLISSDQFAYVAAVGGLMVREQPAAIFLIGYFFAESLYLAETGASTGAIQIAGTDAYTQLPFFITTCDYTLIGEEVYAASAYLSREPRMLGSLRGQDVGKAFLMAAIVIVTVALTVAAAIPQPIPWLENLFKTF